MIRIIAVILAAVIVIGILGSLGFVVVKTIGYMANQHFAVGEALKWAWEDYTNFVTGIFGGAKADPNYFEYEYTVNKSINVVACTAL